MTEGAMHGHHHDDVLLGQHLGTVGSAGRDIDDAGRDLTSSSADANRDLINANGDANRDLINANASGTQHTAILGSVLREGGDGRATTLGASGHVRDSVHNTGQHLTHEVADGHRHLTDTVHRSAHDVEAAVSAGTQFVTDNVTHGNQNLGSLITHGQQAVTADIHSTAQRLGDGQVLWGKNILENVLQNRYDLARDILNEGCKGRETTLTAAAQIREDLATAKADLMKEHCETQRLVITEHCKTREQVAAESVRTRELISAEARATVEREISRIGEENTLLKLRIDILSAGGGPLAR
jgi:hypothetical protein